MFSRMASTAANRPNLEELRRVALEAGLRSCQLFNGLPQADLCEIASFVQVKTLAKGDYLFREGAPAVGFYIVQRGAIDVHRVSAAGKEQVIHVFRSGESLAEAALASPTGYPAEARAVEASSVLLIPKVEFRSLVSKRPELAMRMLGSMSQHLRVLVGLLDDLRLKNIQTRLAHWLVRRCPQPPGSEAVTIKLPGTKRVLAAELGTSAETLSRTLAEFRTQGLVSVKGSAITILEPRVLAEFVGRNLAER